MVEATKEAVTQESILNIPPEKLTPGMRQYQDAKRANPDCIILLRMGDFYELFYEDAVTASRELEITLTARGKGEKRAPLAGVPYHALENYLARLVKKGYKVAIVEQLEDPKKAKGLVKRGLVRIVTPGTVIESSMLNEKENNFIVAVTVTGDKFALASCDLSTGEFVVTTYDNYAALRSEIFRKSPSECIVPESLLVNQELVGLIKASGCFVNTLEDYYFKQDTARTTLLQHFNIQSLDSFAIEGQGLLISASGGLVRYLTDTQKNNLSHITKISKQSNNDVMLVDSATIRNLELLRNMKDGKVSGSLLSVLDKTTTAMGARLLRRWLQEPLLNQASIEKRLNAVELLNKNVIDREELTELLKSIYDIERLISRVNYGNANPKDLLSLKSSLQQLPMLQEKLKGLDCELLQKLSTLPDISKTATLIEDAVAQEPPITIREGGIIKDGFNQELDSLREITKNSKQYIHNLEEREKQKTGITSLRISYNRVFGYFLEVTKKNTHLVPDNYIRKQTTANSERYITEELKVEEEKILGAQEKINELEYRVFQEIIHLITQNTQQIQEVARKVAVVDVLCSLSTVALENGYVKPKFVNQDVIQIRNGRHVVVEKMVDRFIANDVVLGDGEMMIITGPNMSGKSTIMRQTALIVLMAQIGSFVPADEVVMGVVDRVLTRVGAYDDLSSGQSTFMVEMNETAAILNNATSRSLLILDEIGRGTSTFDGVSIAWSVAEHICNNLKAKTMFATHYHVMNKLAEKFSRIKNFNVAVSDKAGEIVLLHKLVEGGCDQSYGIHVAKLAGLPASVVSRAGEIQEILEKDDEMIRKVKAKKLQEQMSLEEF